MIRIDQYHFGTIVINGVAYHHDVQIVKDRVLPEWWRKRGHEVAVEDIDQLMASAPTILVIGKGASGMMTPTPSLISWLKQKNVTLIAENTPKAIRLFQHYYNQGANVSAGFHLTC